MKICRYNGGIHLGKIQEFLEYVCAVSLYLDIVALTILALHNIENIINK